MKRQAKYFRKGTVIRGPEGDQNFQSIALAKKESHRIQKAEGGLGSGVMRVVDTLPPMESVKQSQ